MNIIIVPSIFWIGDSIIIILKVCCFLEGHDKKHKLSSINEKRIFENKDKIYEKSISESSLIFKKAKNLKQRIKEEIDKLNILHKEINDNNLFSLYIVLSLYRFLKMINDGLSNLHLH